LCLNGELGENGANRGGSNGLNGDSKVSNIQMEYNASFGSIFRTATAAEKHSNSF
jgi:hypothetical protein